MNKKTRYCLTIIVTLSIMSLAIIPPSDPFRGFSLSEDEIKSLIAERFDQWPLAFGENETGIIDTVLSKALQSKAIPASWSMDYEYRHTFNFTNSEGVFGEMVMTEEEVHDNLRNYVFQLLYGDLQTACEVSVLDIMLLRVFDSLILDWLPIEFMGFCNGFAQASRDFYLDPSEIPLGKDWAYELPSPDPNETIARQTHGDVSESLIKEYVLWKGSGAFFNPNHLLNWLSIYLGIPLHEGGTNNDQEYLEMTQLMKKGSPSYCPVALLLTAPCWADGSASNSHFVLAYDYETNSNGSRTIYIYNNHDRYTSNDDIYDDWILLKNDGTFSGTHRDPSKGWTRMAAYPKTAEYNSILTALIELLPKVLQFSVLSPVDIHISDPLGRTIGPNENGEIELEFPAVYTENDGHKTILMPYVPGLPYNVNLTGTDTGNYTMRVSRVVDDEIITQEMQGTTHEGELDSYSVRVEGNGIDLGRQGVTLSLPEILSATMLELSWTQYTESDFLRYEIYQSRSIDNIGELVAEIDNPDTTSTTVSGLKAQESYFFTVRVITTGDTHYDSNKVGAIMPESTGYLLWIVAGAGGIAVLMVIVAVRRKRKARG